MVCKYLLLSTGDASTDSQCLHTQLSSFFNWFSAPWIWFYQVQM